MKKSIRLLMAFLLLHLATTGANPHDSDTDWFQKSKYGVFTHFLPADAKSFELVKSYDVKAVAEELHEMGAKYLIITLGQNHGYFISPNSAYDRITGYAPGERCSTRDLPLELSEALASRGIKLMLYLPCQAPNEDPRAQQAFGLPAGHQDQPLNANAVEKWNSVIREWADRYGNKIAGWWFDGAYSYIQFDETIAGKYAASVRHGNPHALVTFNPGVMVTRYTKAENYTAGEQREPFGMIPASRWLEGSQWHVLTFLGIDWAKRDTRYPTEKWVRWVKAATDAQGVVTLDMGPNWDPHAGAIGSYAEAQMQQVRAIRAALDNH